MPVGYLKPDRYPHTREDALRLADQAAGQFHDVGTTAGTGRTPLETSRDHIAS